MVLKMKLLCKYKSLMNSVAFSALALGGLAGTAEADVTFYEANSSNATLQHVGLGQSTLGNATLANPSTITSGSNEYRYVAVQFTAMETGSLQFGMTSSPVDPVMILYNGVYNPANPGNGAVVGNDDTNASIHQANVGAGYTISC